MTTSALRQWRSKHRHELAAGSPAAPPPPPPAPPAPPPAPPNAAEPPGFREALAAAQGVPPAAVPSLDGAPGLPAAVNALPNDPALFTVEHVLALGEITNGLVVRGVAVAKGVEISEAKLEELITFSPRERKALEMFAPFAMPYLPEILQKFPKYAAWGFVAIYGASLLGRVQAVAALAPKKPTLEQREEPRDLQAAA